MHKEFCRHVQDEYQRIISQLCEVLPALHGKRVLITGANGLIASYLIDFLRYYNQEVKASICVYAMSRSSKKLERRFGTGDALFYLVEQDLNEPLSREMDCDYIIHAASNAHPLAFSQDPVGTMKTNLVGTMNLLDLARKTGARFLFISSGEVYGNNENGHAFVETDSGNVNPAQVRACYPESKRAAETLSLAYHSQYQVHVNIARLCYVYGGTITDTNSRADAQFLRNALNHEDIVMKSEGLQRRTYCYVADAAAAILTIMLKGGGSEVYNVANPNSIVSVRQYAEVLAKLCGVQLRFALPDGVEAKGYSKPADSILDASKLIALGWVPVYDIETGLKRTIHSLC